ncbi:afadin- and alpha-actinin-binding protein [Selaginella moellendorffii]|uniref:afadin- and alpha-actinin-binding protein n=1 Tax=Selaginella moellendorffii TaxID=88036 RepID=UPI000D1C92E1|nr:afadin- and alpha-actinin-binding protein [Selaginella moellendorffii]|eukprot:XP_024538063.1 afadin- and alpha-actinin-binding protein [Selaginella moellendorffii]
MGFLSGEEVEQQVFATVHNLEHCVKYINQSLVAYGFPAPLELGSQNPVAVARTCNCLFAILQQRQHDVEFRETVDDQRQRLLSDISRLESKVERLETNLAAKERELSGMLSKEQKMTATFKAQLEKLQQERDEFQRMVIGTQQIRTQQLHEIKKKEKEFLKLQERLNQVLADKKKESRSGMEIMSLLQKESRQRGTWSSKKADGDFYKMIVDTYESKKQELMTENAELKTLLRAMQMDMRNFLNNSQTSCDNDLPDRPVTPLGGRADLFDLPFHIAKDQIEESLRSKMASIKEYIIQFQQAEKGMQLVSEATERELELEAQLVEARSIIQEQAAAMSKLSEGYIDENHVDELQGYGSGCSLLQRMSHQLDKERLEMVQAKERLQEEQEAWNVKLSKWTSEIESPNKVLNCNAEAANRSHGFCGGLTESYAV